MGYPPENTLTGGLSTMGGSEILMKTLSSVASNVIGGVISGGATSPSNNLAAERKAREEEQRQEEAEERRRERDKVMEARDLEKRRKAEAITKSTLGNGAAGLTNSPEVGVSKLKTKLGE